MKKKDSHIVTSVKPFSWLSDKANQQKNVNFSDFRQE